MSTRKKLNQGKADTYSYGIVVLEILSGQKSTNVKVDDEGREYLLQRVSKLLQLGTDCFLVIFY